MLIDSIKQISSKHQYLLLMRPIHLIKTVNNKEEKEFHLKLLYQTIFLGIIYRYSETHCFSSTFKFFH